MRVRQLQHDVPELSKFGFYNKQVLVMTLNVTGDLRLLLKDKVQRTFHFFEGHIEFPLTGGRINTLATAGSPVIEQGSL